MIVYIFDCRWPGAFRPSRTHSSRTRVEMIMVNSRETLGDLCRKVKAVSQQRSIWMLRVCGHGNSGVIQVAEGITSQTASKLRPLRPYFTPDGPGIEIHACGVASASSIVEENFWGAYVCIDGTVRLRPGTGRQLLERIHQATGVPVTAGVNCQLTDPDFVFEGPTVTFPSAYERHHRFPIQRAH